MNHSNYLKLLLMLTASFFVMYGVMFLNVANSDHVWLSKTRFYMAMLMVSPMALLKLIIMKDMYLNRNYNWAISAAAVFIFLISLLGLRNQWGISDRQYMKAMIPHHSSAILTSMEADITDPKVQELAIQIIETQKKEIAQMEELLQQIEK